MDGKGDIKRKKSKKMVSLDKAGFMRATISSQQHSKQQQLVAEATKQEKDLENYVETQKDIKEIQASGIKKSFIVESTAGDRDVTSRGDRDVTSQVDYKDELRQITLERNKLKLKVLYLQHEVRKMRKLQRRNEMGIDVKLLEKTHLIGDGCMATVYAGHYGKRLVVVKKLRYEMTPSDLCYLEAEARILRDVKHPNVCDVIGVTSHDKFDACIVSEYCVGSTLNDVMVTSGYRYGLEGDVYIKIASEISVGMNYLHQHQPAAILHLNLKPSNIFVNDRNCVKICDFAFSKLR